MKVLVTGASGLIGGRLIEHLSKQQGLLIRAASRVARDWGGAVDGVIAHAGEPASFDDACRGMDAIVNLASMGEAACAGDPELALVTNAGGTLSLAKAAKRAGVKKFVQVSTAKVYGPPKDQPLTEDSPTDPRSHYAITHRAAEDYATAEHPCAVIFRLANGFGAAVDAAVGWDVIANDMCRQVVSNGEITIRSSGLASRNFIPLTDVVGAISFALGSLPPGRFNLGAQKSMTLLSLAECIGHVARAELGRDVPIRSGIKQPGEINPPLDFRIDKLAAAGFTPHNAVGEEISATLRKASVAFPAGAR